MKTMSVLSCILLVTLTFSALSGSAQNGSPLEKHPRNNVKNIKSRTKLGIKRIYHPAWGPRLTFRNRWIYFPLYDVYWDNVRNVYIIKRGNKWVTLNTKPKEIEKVDLLKERIVELKDEENKTDVIQEKNAEHKEKYKNQISK